VLRHRGKSPRQTAFFFRSPELRFHAANLASLFVLYGLLHASSRGVESGFRVGSLESGALLCGGYEAYRELHSPAFISFEHAWFLLLALRRRDEIALWRCAECGGVGLHDRLAKRGSACMTCASGNGLRSEIGVVIGYRLGFQMRRAQCFAASIKSLSVVSLVRSCRMHHWASLAN
jgi:hypothetical protein